MHLRLSDAAQIEPPGSHALPLAHRDAVLLAWLAINGPTTRDRLAGLLWPASTQTQARNTLRQRLFKLRKQALLDLVEGSTTLRLAEGITHDLADSSELLGDLLVPDAAECNAWLIGERERRRAREQEALREQAQALEDAGDVVHALAAARSSLRLAPLSEAAHRHVMRLHYLQGDLAGAMLAFDHCEQTLKHEIGARPSAETLALLATIEHGALPVQTTARDTVPASVLRPPRMIGRARESALFEQAWATGHVAVVVGEAGVGKTRLLRDQIDRHIGVVRAAARPGDAAVPLACVARLLRAIHAFDSGVALAVLDDATRGELARVVPEWGAVRGDAGALHALQRAIGAYVRQVSRLHGLIVDDLHFADDASVEMLHALIEPGAAEGAGDRCRWALAFRGAEVATPLQALRDALTDAARLVVIPLAPLGEQPLAELVDSLGVAALNGAALAPALCRQTGGNPLFVLETLKQAWVEQRLAADGAAARVELPRPESVARLIERRLTQLSTVALSFARVAGIAGVDMDVALAESVLGTRAVAFADALAELESAGIMRGTEFAHDLVHDAVRAGVPEAIARHLHAQVAAWLEDHQGEPARVARHWIDAAMPRRAVPWLARAAEKARLGLSPRGQLDFLLQLAEIEEASGDTNAAFDAVLAAASAHLDVDRDADDGYARCDRLDRLAQTPAQRIHARLARASLATRRGDTGVAEPAAQDALNDAVALGDAALIGESQLTLFDEWVTQGRAQEALRLADACRDWVDRYADANRRGSFHAAWAILLDNIGALDAARFHHQRAMAIAEETGNRLQEAILAGNLACNRINAGEVSAGAGLCEQALRLFDVHDGGQADRCVPLLNLAECLVQTGRYAQALRRVEEVSELLARAAPTVLPVAFCHLAACWWQLGQSARARQALERVGDAKRAPLSARVRRHRLRFLMNVDGGADALAELDRGLALLEGENRPDLRLMLRIERAALLPADLALAELDMARRDAHERQFAGHELEALLRGARIATPLEPSRALELARQALAIAGDAEPIFSYAGELWLRCAQAFIAAGETAAARDVLRQGRAWVVDVADHHVPPEYRDGFLNRNPVNLELLALASTQLRGNA